MKSFDNFFKETTQHHLNTSSSSTSTYAAIISIIDDYRAKEWGSLYLFYLNTHKNIRLNSEGIALIKDYVSKYKTWANLEGEFNKNTKSLVRDYKPLKNYKMYLLSQEKKKEYIQIFHNKVKDMKTSDLAKMLNVSQNVASAFKRGETNRVSYQKILDAKLGWK